jgi:peptidoglycan/LPS O-acetylase OafA/YrhL
MLRSSYAELEDSASKGRVIIIIALVLHLAACVLSMAGLPPIRMVVPMLIQFWLCGALFAGRGWARWVLVVLNVLGFGLTAYLAASRENQRVEFEVVRSAVCAVIALLLLLPPVRNYVVWKRMRF